MSRIRLSGGGKVGAGPCYPVATDESSGSDLLTKRRIVTEPHGRKVLVTGARGFVGRSVTRALVQRGWEVHGLVTAEPTRPGETAIWHTGDLLAAGTAEAIVEALGPSHLVHLAWAPNRGVYESLDNFQWVEASLELLRAFAAGGGSRAVFVGSCAEYEWGSDEPLAEDAPLARDNAYAAAKTSLGRLFRDYCSLSGFSGAWARPFFLFGPAEPRQRLVASVVTALLAGEPAPCSHGEQIRDYLYVRDAADALAALLDSELQGAVNVASGEGTRLKDLVTEVARRLQGEELLQLGAIPPPEDEPPRVVAAIDRLRDELGWRPAYDLEEAIDETITWWARRMTH